MSTYTEDTLVQQTTADYLEQQFDWRSAYAYIKEGFGSVSQLGHGTARRLYDFVIFESEEPQVEVRLERETLWVTQDQIAELFEPSTDNISLHLKSVYREAELEEQAITEDVLVVRQEVRRRVRRIFIEQRAGD